MCVFMCAVLPNVKTITFIHINTLRSSWLWPNYYMFPSQEQNLWCSGRGKEQFHISFHGRILRVLPHRDDGNGQREGMRPSVRDRRAAKQWEHMKPSHTKVPLHQGCHSRCRSTFPFFLFRDLEFLRTFPWPVAICAFHVFYFSCTCMMNDTSTST